MINIDTAIFLDDFFITTAIILVLVTLVVAKYLLIKSAKYRSLKSLPFYNRYEILTENNDHEEELRYILSKNTSILGFIDETGVDGIWYTNLEKKVVWYSPKFLQTLGYDKNDKIASFEFWQEIIHPEDLKRSMELFAKHLEDPQVMYDINVRYYHKQGHIIWIRCRGTVIMNNEGVPTRMIGTHSDITNVVLETQKANSINEQLKLFIEYSPAAIAIFDRNLCYIMHSKRWLTDYNLGDIDIIGKSHYEVFPDIKETWKQNHIECLKGVTKKCDQERFDRYDGRVDWIKWEIRPWYLGNDVGGIIMLTEVITDRVLLEQQKTNAVAWLENIMSSTPDGILVITDNLKIHTVNKAILNMTGYSEDELINSDIFGIIREDKAGFHIVRKNSEFIPVEIEYNPMIITNREKYTIASIRDISDRVKIENELIAHKNNLQKLLADQTKDIIAQKDKAEKANKAKSEFLSNMSHELRTPMHAILNYAKMGINQISDNDITKLYKYFNNIHISGDRLLGLLNNLLDLSKMESGKMEYDFQPHSIKDVLENSLNEIEPIIKSKNIKISRSVLTDNLVINFDKTKIIQVMINLLSNSVKFSGDNTVISITIETYKSVDYSNALKVTIKDQGEGIPENELSKIFDKFTQSKRTKTGAGGTGLGLAICKEIIEAHKGKIWAEKSIKGAVLAFVIPFNLTNKKEQ